MVRLQHQPHGHEFEQLQEIVKESKFQKIVHGVTKHWTGLST